MGSEFSPADWHIGDFDGSEEPASLQMHVLPVHIVVPGKFGMDVRECIWHRGLVGSVKLGSQSRVEGKWEDNFPGAHKLVRVLYGYAPLELVSEMVDGPELRRTCIRKADVSLGVLADGHKDITRTGREPDAVGGLHAPGLAAQKFPLAAL